MNRLKRWWRKLTTRTLETRILLKRSGQMTDAALTAALEYSPECSLMRALEEIRARMEDQLNEEAFYGDDAKRLRNLARQEGMDEYYKQIMAWRESGRRNAETEK